MKKSKFNIKLFFLLFCFNIFHLLIKGILKRVYLTGGGSVGMQLLKTN